MNLVIRQRLAICAVVVDPESMLERGASQEIRGKSTLVGRGRREAPQNSSGAFVSITALTASPTPSTARPIAAGVTAGARRPETVTIAFTRTTTASFGTNLKFTPVGTPPARGASDNVGATQATRAISADHRQRARGGRARALGRERGNSQRVGEDNKGRTRRPTF